MDGSTLKEDLLSDLHEQATLATSTDIHDSRVLSGSDDEVPQFSMANKDMKRVRDLYGTDDKESDSTDDDNEYEDDIGYTTLPISAIAPPSSPISYRFVPVSRIVERNRPTLSRIEKSTNLYLLCGLNLSHGSKMV
jgi:hypothetical protein